jgi:hypothetical protein
VQPTLHGYKPRVGLILLLLHRLLTQSRILMLTQCFLPAQIPPLVLLYLRRLRPFTLDATVFPNGVNSPIAQQSCCATQPFTTWDVTGHHSWVCVPPSDLHDYVAHYVEQKSKATHNTSACFAVPKWRNLPHTALANMQVIKQYRKGYHLMQRGSKRDKGLLDETLIYYDPPEPV